MNPLDIRKGLDRAIDKLKCAAADSNSEPVKGKLRRAYGYLAGQLEAIDREVLLELELESVA